MGYRQEELDASPERRDAEFRCVMRKSIVTMIIVVPLGVFLIVFVVPLHHRLGVIPS